MINQETLAARIERRRSFVKEHSRWGLLPPQRQGVGLVLSIVSIVSLVAVLLVFAFGSSSGLTTALFVIALVANVANIVRTKKWLDAQLAS